VGDYRILREVGRGGMGIVYEAEQVSLGRRVALKVLPANLLSDPRQVRRFEREARSAAKLHHTNIVPVFGVGQAEGLHFIVMQFISGRSLSEIIRELSDGKTHPGEPSLRGMATTWSPACWATSASSARSAAAGWGSSTRRSRSR